MNKNIRQSITQCQRGIFLFCLILSVLSVTLPPPHPPSTPPAATVGLTLISDWFGLVECQLFRGGNTT